MKETKITREEELVAFKIQLTSEINAHQHRCDRISKLMSRRSAKSWTEQKRLKMARRLSIAQQALNQSLVLLEQVKTQSKVDD